MENNNQIQRIIEISKLYYEEGLTQLQIAKRFGVSRALVGIQLARAKELGIVSIEIKSPFIGNEYLLTKLKNKWGIKGGVIIPSGKGDFYRQQVLLSHTCKFLIEQIEQSSHIGMGWGFMLDEVISSITDGAITGGQRVICPLLGNLDSPHRGFHPNELVRSLSKKINADGVYLYAPVFPLSGQEQALYMNTENYSQIEQEWSKLDLAIVSISPFPSVPDLATAYRYGSQHYSITGDVIAFAYDQHGKFIPGENDFAVRIPMENFLRIRNILVICPANINTDAVRGALMTGMISNIILDENTAKAVING